MKTHAKMLHAAMSKQEIDALPVFLETTLILSIFILKYSLALAMGGGSVFCEVDSLHTNYGNEYIF